LPPVGLWYCCLPGRLLCRVVRGRRSVDTALMPCSCRRSCSTPR